MDAAGVKRVLIIDDDEALLDVLSRRVKKNSYTCETAQSASEGLEKARNLHPDLILLDLMMPKMSGFGFLRELKRHKELAHIPVVVLTGLGDDEVAKESMDLGAVGYLTKDCDHGELMHIVQQHA